MLMVAVACLAIYNLYKVQILMARVDDVLREEASKNKPPKSN